VRGLFWDPQGAHSALVPVGTPYGVRGLFCPSPPEGKEGGLGPFFIKGFVGRAHKTALTKGST